MTKRLFSVLTILCLMLAAFTIPVSATETTEATEPTNVPREPGYCAETMTWAYADGVLTISGEGEMDDFPEGAPWAAYKDAVTELIISDGITYIGAYAFPDFDKLETVRFGNAVYEIGKEAFRSCDALTSISLPASFKIFGESCFQDCRKLQEIHCAGRFPSFRLNCLWGSYLKIYFPAEQPWSVDLIQELEGAFSGRIEFLSSDGSDPYEPTEATTAPEETEPETAPPTTEAETVPTTEATVPTTQATQPPQTTAPETQPEPTEPSVTEPAPEEEAEPEGGSSWIGLVIIGVVAVFLLLGALIFRGRRGGKYAR